jgi:formylglycine-generating enzyme required for sulfatase activity
MVMAYVPAGTFYMGSNSEDELAAEYEKPPREVYLDAFWIDQTEVTVGQYRACVDAGVCSTPRQSSSATRPDYFFGGAFDDYPVLWVTWDDAVTYCRWVGSRLPTEAEWEMAARGPDGRIFPWGDSWNESCTNAMNRLGDTRPVGSYPCGASPYNVLDMSGNVWEWVNDWFSDTYYADAPTSNPQGPSQGSQRAVRSGSWYSRLAWQRSANRGSAKPDFADDDIGFRCAQDAISP